MVEAAFRENVPGVGTLGLRSEGEKDIPGRGNCMFRSEDNPSTREGLKECPARLECREQGQEEMGEGGRDQIMEVVWGDGISPDTGGKLLRAPR